MGIADIESMTIPERLQAIELLWTSVARTDTLVESPEWHGRILDARRKKVEDGKGVFLTLSQVRDHLAKS